MGYKLSIGSTATHDLAYQADRLLDHVGGDVEMSAGPDPAVHHGEQHAVASQGFDNFLAADAGAVGAEEHQVGLGLLHLHAADLRQAARQRPRIGVIVREAVDMMVERMEAGGSADAGLAHRSAEALLPAPDLVDEIAGARDHAADRRAEPLGEIDPGRIPS